jgi:DNA polymerase-3 subunit alpha
VLTGGAGGPLDLAFAAGQAELAAARCERLARLFGDRLYVELQRHALPEEKQLEPALLDLAYTKGLPLVAANEPYYPRREDFEAHDALICIAEGRLIAESERRQLSPEHYFKSRAEMAALFADLPEALASTVEIAQRCAYRPKKRDPILPRFTAPDGTAVDEAAELRREAEKGLTRRINTLGLASGRTIEDIASGSTSSSASSRACAIRVIS